jgi:hypothetical protein
MSETMQFEGTQKDWECYEINVVQSRMYGCNIQCKECKKEQVNIVNFENTNVLPNQSSTDENDDLTDDELVIKELKKEIETLYTEQQIQESMLLILEYIVGQMGKGEKINTRKKSEEIIASFKKPK